MEKRAYLLFILFLSFSHISSSCPNEYKQTVHFGNEIYQPFYVTGTPSGQVYTLDERRWVIQYDCSLNKLRQFGSYGNATSSFLSPSSLTSDYKGDVYVGDASTCAVTKFSSNGVFLSKFGSCGNSSTQFVSLRSLSSCGDSLIALDQYTSLLKVFSLEGKLKLEFGEQIFCFRIVKSHFCWSQEALETLQVNLLSLNQSLALKTGFTFLISKSTTFKSSPTKESSSQSGVLRSPHFCSH